VIDSHLNPRFLTSMTSYDVSSSICQALGAGGAPSKFSMLPPARGEVPPPPDDKTSLLAAAARAAAGKISTNLGVPSTGKESAIQLAASTPAMAGMHAGALTVAGRGLHSSTFSLDVSTFCLLQSPTFQFDVSTLHVLSRVFEYLKCLNFS